MKGYGLLELIKPLQALKDLENLIDYYPVTGNKVFISLDKGLWPFKIAKAFTSLGILKLPYRKLSFKIYKSFIGLYQPCNG